MTETSHDRASRYLSEVSGNTSKKSYTSGEVRHILENVLKAAEAIVVKQDDTCRSPTETKALRRGDVFIFKAIGGKVRPWITLSVCGDLVNAVAMSSGDKAPNMVQSKCRLWPSGWIGVTVAQFSHQSAIKEVTRPYTNLAHLNEIEQRIAAALGMELARKPIGSISEIRARMIA